MGYRLRFDKEKCVGCYACHMACLDAHHDVAEDDVKSHRAIVNVVTKTFQKNICPGCIHCGKCMTICPEQAIYKDVDTGFILTDRIKCIGCRVCEEVCPVHVIHFDKKGKMEKCDGCIERVKAGKEPACVRVCSMDAITIEKV